MRGDPADGAGGRGGDDRQLLDAPGRRFQLVAEEGVVAGNDPEDVHALRGDSVLLRVPLRPGPVRSGRRLRGGAETVQYLFGDRFPGVRVQKGGVGGHAVASCAVDQLDHGRLDALGIVGSARAARPDASSRSRMSPRGTSARMGFPVAMYSKVFAAMHGQSLPSPGRSWFTTSTSALRRSPSPRPARRGERARPSVPRPDHRRPPATPRRYRPGSRPARTGSAARPPAVAPSGAGGRGEGTTGFGAGARRRPGCTVPIARCRGGAGCARTAGAVVRPRGPGCTSTRRGQNDPAGTQGRSGRHVLGPDFPWVEAVGDGGDAFRREVRRVLEKLPPRGGRVHDDVRSAAERPALQTALPQVVKAALPDPEGALRPGVLELRDPGDGQAARGGLPQQGGTQGVRARPDAVHRGLAVDGFAGPKRVRRHRTRRSGTRQNDRRRSKGGCLSARTHGSCRIAGVRTMGPSAEKREDTVVAALGGEASARVLAQGSGDDGQPDAPPGETLRDLHDPRGPRRVEGRKVERGNGYVHACERRSLSPGAGRVGGLGPRAIAPCAEPSCPDTPAGTSPRGKREEAARPGRRLATELACPILRHRARPFHLDEGPASSCGGGRPSPAAWCRPAAAVEARETRRHRSRAGSEYGRHQRGGRPRPDEDGPCPRGDPGHAPSTCGRRDGSVVSTDRPGSTRRFMTTRLQTSMSRG